MTGDEISQIHDNIILSIMQLRQYDKMDIWTDEIRENVIALCADLEHYAGRETEYYKTYRQKNIPIKPRD